MIEYHTFVFGSGQFDQFVNVSADLIRSPAVRVDDTGVLRRIINVLIGFADVIILTQLIARLDCLRLAVGGFARSDVFDIFQYYPGYFLLYGHGARQRAAIQIEFDVFVAIMML